MNQAFLTTKSSYALATQEPTHLLSSQPSITAPVLPKPPQLSPACMVFDELPRRQVDHGREYQGAEKEKVEKVQECVVTDVHQVEKEKQKEDVNVDSVDKQGSRDWNTSFGESKMEQGRMERLEIEVHAEQK